MMTTPKQFPGWADHSGRSHNGYRIPQKPVPVRLPDINDTAVQNKPTVADVRRSDEQLRKKVLEQLGDLGEQMRITVQVAVEKGEVFLKGNVDSNYNRLVITSSVARICGPKNLRDQLSIRSRFSDPTTSRTADSIESLKSKPALLSGIAAGVAVVALIAFIMLSRQGVFLERLHNIPLKVVYDGKPAAGAQITLHPKAGKTADQPLPIGQVEQDGTLTWRTGDRTGGVPVGDYIATATWIRMVTNKFGDTTPGNNLLPAELGKVESSPFSIEVSNKTSPQQWELKKP